MIWRETKISFEIRMKAFYLDWIKKQKGRRKEGSEGGREERKEGEGKGREKRKRER
jgi:hypothetical protein